MTSDAIGDLRTRMEAAAAAMDFEEARRLRDAINLVRGGATVQEALSSDTSGLNRQAPGAMGLGSSRQQVRPPENWKRPAKPDPMTGGQKCGGEVRGPTSAVASPVSQQSLTTPGRWWLAQTRADALNRARPAPARTVDARVFAGVRAGASAMAMRTGSVVDQMVPTTRQQAHANQGLRRWPALAHRRITQGGYMGRFGIAFSIALMSSGVAHAGRSTEGDATVAALSAAWNAHDARRYAALFAPDAAVVTSQGAVLSGGGEIERQIGQGFATIFARSRMRAEDQSFHPLGSDTMLGRVTWRISGMRSPDGASIADHEIVQTQVLARTPDGWRILSLQDTPVIDAGTDASGSAMPSPPSQPPSAARRCIVARANGDCLIHGKAR